MNESSFTKQIAFFIGRTIIMQAIHHIRKKGIFQEKVNFLVRYD